MELKNILHTVAFGMGIDQIVKCVIIIGAPHSIEDYYQQIDVQGAMDIYRRFFFRYSIDIYR